MIEKREDCIKGKIMKKIGVIIPLSIAVVIIGMVVFTQLYQDKKQKEDKYIVTVSNWNGMEKRYAVCEIETDKDVDKNFSECITNFKTDLELKELAEQNNDFIEQIKYHDSLIEYDANLYFSDNSYYVIYYNAVNGGYTATSCYLDNQLNGSPVYIPSPVYLVLSEEVVEMYQSEGYNLLSYLFDNYDFADAKEFYERFTKDIVQIDEENKQISVSGYDPFDDIMIEKCITLDFTNHTVIGKDKEGKEIVIDGK